jgi:shikimate kinase
MAHTGGWIVSGLVGSLGTALEPTLLLLEPGAEVATRSVTGPLFFFFLSLDVIVVDIWGLESGGATVATAAVAEKINRHAQSRPMRWWQQNSSSQTQTKMHLCRFP